MQDIAKIMMGLVRYEFGEELTQEIKNSITGKNLPLIYDLAKKHDIVHLVADALLKNQMLPEGTIAFDRFSHERNLAILRYEQIKHEFDDICKTFEEAKIVFIPLKGSITREYYPEPWMRTSCDIDIYINPIDLDKAVDVLVQKLEYKFDFKREHDAILTSPSGVPVELRYNPSSATDKAKPIILKALKDVADNNVFNQKLKDDAFYFYHIEHMAGHFAIGGCGVRFFLDAWILNKALKFGGQKEIYLIDSGLDVFEKNAIKTAEYWFNCGESNAIVSEMEEYVLSSGTYGTMENRVAIDTKKQGKLKFIFSRIFLPYNVIKMHYPILQKCPILLPFYQVKRWFNLLNKNRREKSINELKEATEINDQRQNKIDSLMKNLKLR